MCGAHTFTRHVSSLPSIVALWRVDSKRKHLRNLGSDNDKTNNDNLQHRKRTVFDNNNIKEWIFFFLHFFCPVDWCFRFRSFHSSPDLISNVNTLFKHCWFEEEAKQKKANASNPMKDFNYFPVNLHSFVSALQSAWARCERRNFEENDKRRHAHVIRWMGTVGEQLLHPFNYLPIISIKCNFPTDSFFLHLHLSVRLLLSLLLLLLFDNYLHC